MQKKKKYKHLKTYIKIPIFIKTHTAKIINIITNITTSYTS